MSLIKNLIDRHKAKKLAEEAELKRKNDAYLATLDAKLATAKEEMFLNHCPINGGLCEESCVHFEDGMVRRMHSVGECSCFSWYVTEPCNCKLWRKR